MPGLAIRHNARWKTRLTIFLALMLPVYILPSIGRTLSSGLWGWLVGALLLDVVGWVTVGFLSNSYPFALVLYLSSTVLELVLLWAGMTRAGVIWAGDLVPALVAIYFVQQLYINMGD